MRFYIKICYIDALFEIVVKFTEEKEKFKSYTNNNLISIAYSSSCVGGNTSGGKVSSLALVGIINDGKTIIF